MAEQQPQQQQQQQDVGEPVCDDNGYSSPAADGPQQEESLASPGNAPSTDQPRPADRRGQDPSYAGNPQAEENSVVLPAGQSSHPVSPTDKEATHDHVARAVAHPRPRARWNRDLCIGPRSWGLETASILFSLSCFVAMVVVLAKINGRLLSSWGLPVSPNAVISILSTASKATLILPIAECISQLKWLHLGKRGYNLEQLEAYDGASRGSWGSVKFFWSARGAMLVTYLGCLMTIAAVALDPFSQQLLSYEQLPTLVPDLQSSVASSQVYDNGGQGVSGISGLIYSTRDGRLQAAAIAGLYDLVPPPPFVCPGSNCTYPTFTSLGVTSDCVSVTGQASKVCGQGPTIRSESCNYTLPKGVSIGAVAVADPHGGFRHTTINATLNKPLRAPGVDQSIIAELSVIMFDNGDMQNAFGLGSKWQETLKAWQCTYWLRALAFVNWTSVNGTVRPGLMQVSRLNMTRGHYMTNFQALEDGFPGNLSFAINYFDLDNMGNVFRNIFQPQPDRSADFISGLYYSRYLNALYDSPNLTATIANVATSMSYRMLSGPNATAVYGDVFAVQIYMTVRWAWLALAATLIVLTFSFLLTVVIKTEVAGLRVWKSSLAPLVHGDLSKARDTGDESPRE